MVLCWIYYHEQNANRKDATTLFSDFIESNTLEKACEGRQPLPLKGNMHLGRHALHQNSFRNKNCFPAEVFLILDLLLWRFLFLCCDAEMVNSKLLKWDLKSLMKEPDVLPDFSFPLQTKALNAEGWKAYYHQKEM